MKISMTGVNPRTSHHGRRARPGYTLIELLIVTAIFTIAMTILSSTYISFNQLQRKVANRAVLGQDMRFAMEAIIRAARNLPIDYSATLPAKDSQITFIVFNVVPVTLAKRSAPDCTDTTVSSCLAISVGGGPWSQLTSNRVEVTNFDVYVRPAVSPFEAVGNSYPNNTQPFVTLNLGLKYKAERPKDEVTLQAQTAVASRLYLR